jgi:prephenate dehydratase
VLRENVQDRDDNETRFVWLAPAGDGTGRRAPLREAGGAWKTSLVFWGAGADSPGWLVRCLGEFADRELNLTKIESRPQRAKLGHYMFFADVQGSIEEERVARAVAALRELCEEVRVLGCYRAA